MELSLSVDSFALIQLPNKNTQKAGYWRALIHEVIAAHPWAALKANILLSGYFCFGPEFGLNEPSRLSLDVLVRWRGRVYLPRTTGRESGLPASVGSTQAKS